MHPVPEPIYITQTYDQHVARAKANGWCWKPAASCPRGWYYGGIDYGVPVGTQVKTPLAGVIQSVKRETTGYGLHVKLQTDAGLLLIFAHLSKTLVDVNQRVGAGELLALSGNTGNSTGPHLHFEARDRGGVPFDPMPLTRGEPGPEPEPEPVDDGYDGEHIKIVASGRVAIRKKPARGVDTFLAWLPVGTIVRATGDTVESDGLTWYEVTCYVAAELGDETLAELV